MPELNNRSLSRRLSPIAALTAALLLSGCAQWRSPGSSALPDTDIPYSRFVLDNGLTLLVHEDRKAPIVSVNVWYHVGSKDEQPGRTGFAHLFEHLMFSGTEHYDDEYIRALEEVGATDLNGTTNYDRTNYFANVPTPALDRALWLESERMGHLLGVITQDKLDEQRGVVKNEKRQRRSGPYGRVWELIPEYSYPPNHPYSWSVIGSMEDLDAATLDDVHEWFRQYYGAANAVIAIAGDIDPETALARVEHYFGDIPAGPPVTRRKRWIAPMDSDRRLAIRDKVPQSRLYRVWNVPGLGSDDEIALDVAARLLGGGKTSRLYERLVRDSQLATDVYAGVDSRELGGQFIVMATAQPGADLVALEAALNDELEKFLDEGPTNEEMRRSVTGLVAGFLRGAERIGGFGGKSDILASGEIYSGDPAAWKTSLATLQRLSKNEVRERAKGWLERGALNLEVHPESTHSSSSVSADRSQLPAVGAAPDLRLPALQRRQLANGMQLIVAERHSAPLVYFQLISDVGYAADQQSVPGMANMALAMIDEGTASRSAVDISRELESLGASIGAGSSLDVSTITLSSIRGRVEPALDVFSDVIRNPAFPDEELSRLKKQTIAGIKQEKSRPFSLALRVVPPLLFGDGHAYSLPLTGSGTEASVAALTADHVRRFYSQWVRPDNSSLLIAGDITVDEAEALAKRYFGDWQAALPAPPAKAMSRVADQPDPRVFIMDRPGAEQSVIIAGQLAPPRSDPDDIALSMVNAIFGGMFTSRLNLNLREDKHWSYGARAALIDARGQRPLLAYSQVQGDKTAAAMQEIRQEMNGMLGSRPLRPEEVEGARKYLTLSLPGAHETTAEILGSLSEQMIFNLPDDYYATYVSTVRGMPLPTLRAAARRLYRPGALTWVVVGDLASIEKNIRALKLGEVTILDNDGQPVR